MPSERDDSPGERTVAERGHVVQLSPTQRGAGTLARGLSLPDHRCGALGDQQVTQVEMDMVIRPRMLIEMHDVRPGGGVAHGDARLLTRLAQRRVLRSLIRLDMATGLQPASETSVQVQEHQTPLRVEHDGRRGDVHRQRGARERVVGPVEMSAQLRDRLTFGVIDRDVGVEPPTQIVHAPIGQALAPGAGRPFVLGTRTQLNTSLARTAPVLSRS